jgi:hypothetical protein
MVTNTNKMPDIQLVTLAKVAKVLGFVLPKAWGMDEAVFMELWAQTNCNRFGIFDVASSETVGTAMYHRVHLFNHSCYPNCSCVFGSSTKSLRCITVNCFRDVGAGGELHISYLDDLVQPCEARRTYLNRHYLFHCSCQRCQEQATGGGEVDEVYAAMTTSGKLCTLWARSRASGEHQLSYDCSAKYRAAMGSLLPPNYYQLVRINLMAAREANELKASAKSKIRKQVTAQEQEWRREAHQLAIKCYGPRHPWTELLHASMGDRGQEAFGGGDHSRAEVIYGRQDLVGGIVELQLQ